jgi:hypothetical protein
MFASALRSTSLKRESSAEAFGTAAVASAVVPSATSPVKRLSSSFSGCLSPQQQQLISNPPLVAAAWGHGSVAAAAEAWNHTVEQARNGTSSRGSSAPSSPARNMAVVTMPAAAPDDTSAAAAGGGGGWVNNQRALPTGGGGRVALVADAFKVGSQKRSKAAAVAASGGGLWGSGTASGTNSPTSRLSQTDAGESFGTVSFGNGNGVGVNGASAHNCTGNDGSSNGKDMDSGGKWEEADLLAKGGSCYVTPIGSPSVSEGGAPPAATGE